MGHIADTQAKAMPISVGGSSCPDQMQNVLNDRAAVAELLAGDEQLGSGGFWRA